MISRQSKIEEIALQAIRAGRTFADAFQQVELERDSAHLQGLLGRLVQGDVFDRGDAQVLHEVRALLVARLNAANPGYGELVFAGSSDDTPSADPEIEQVRRVAEQYKQFCFLRQDLFDRIAAERAVSKLMRAA